MPDYNPKYCAPGDDQNPLWILIFEDRDQGHNFYKTEAEAREAWERHCGPSGMWNGRLLQTVERDTRRHHPTTR